MLFTTLDVITRSILLKKRLPLHFYLEFLKYSSDCVRELTQDTLQTTNTVQLTLNSYFAVDLPCDYVGEVAIGIPIGQLVRPVVQLNTISNLLNYDANGNPIPYATTPQPLAQYFPQMLRESVYNNINELGENVGRQYGVDSGSTSLSYKIIPSRNQIQFFEGFPSATVILEYVSDGQCVDNLSKIDIRAQATIEAYADWMWKMHARRSSPVEIQMAKDNYGKELRKTRARIQNVDLTDIRQAIWRNYNGAPKV